MPANKSEQPAYPTLILRHSRYSYVYIGRSDMRAIAWPFAGGSSHAKRRRGQKFGGRQQQQQQQWKQRAFNDARDCLLLWKLVKVSGGLFRF